MTIIYISIKNLQQKSDLACTYYLDLVEAITTILVIIFWHFPIMKLRCESPQVKDT